MLTGFILYADIMIVYVNEKIHIVKAYPIRQRQVQFYSQLFPVEVVRRLFYFCYVALVSAVNYHFQHVVNAVLLRNLFNFSYNYFGNFDIEFLPNSTICSFGLTFEK